MDDVMKYKNPPLTEAVCEFVFIPSKPWDITVPGAFYEKICKDFPGKETVNNLHVGVNEKGVGALQVANRIQFWASDKVKLVQLLEDTLTINHLKPYSTWNNFKRLILKNLKIYKAIAKPKGLKKIGLRYINSFEIEGNIKNFFNCYPKLPKEYNKKYQEFFVNVILPQKNNYDNLTLGLHTVPGTEGKTIILDLDYMMVVPEGISFKEVESWIENAHNEIEKTFESCITSKNKSMLE